jgi:hypothetical protein
MRFYRCKTGSNNLKFIGYGYSRSLATCINPYYSLQNEFVFVAKLYFRIKI